MPSVERFCGNVSSPCGKIVAALYRDLIDVPLLTGVLAGDIAQRGPHPVILGNPLIEWRIEPPHLIPLRPPRLNSNHRIEMLNQS